MKQFSKELGKVSITPKGDWNSSIANEKLDIVYDRRNNQAYIAKQDVPIGVDIDNREYWQPLNATGYADNNFINLTAEDENGTITAYESLEEAVATIFPINRRVGATLSFYNLNSDRLDRQAEFELWQFNSTDLANWENKDYWNNIYYNWNVFVGWYIDADALNNHVNLPNVGQYAYVGSNLNDAILYQCRTNGTWTNTGIKVRNYISVVVSGNITIGENGNWFSNGEDTGIPATPAVDEQLDNIITKHESLSRTVQGIAATGGASTATNVTYNNDSSRLNAENAQDAIDELQSSKIDKTSILQESGTAIDKVMSQGAIKTELDKKADKETVKTELGKKFDKESVAQESGDSEELVMSQKAVSDKHQILSKDLLDVNDLFSVSKEWKKIAEGTFTEEGKPATITLDFEIGKTYVLKISGATPNNTTPKFYTANRGDVVETIWDKRLTTESKTIEFVAKKNASHFRTVCYGGLCSYTLEVKNVTSSFKDNVLKEIGKVDVLSKQLDRNTESIFNKTYLDTSGHTSIKVNSDGTCTADARFFGYRYNDFTVKSGFILNIKTSNHNNSSLVVAIYSEKVVVGINKEKCLQIATYDSATEHNIELKIEHNGYLIFCFNGYQTTPSVSAIVSESYNSVFEQYLYPYKNKKLFVIGDSYTKDAVEHYNKYGKKGYVAAILNRTKMKLCDDTTNVSFSNVCGLSGSQLQRFTSNLLFGVELYGQSYKYTDTIKKADVVLIFGGTNNYGLGNSTMTLGSYKDKNDNVNLEDVTTDANTLPHTIYGSVKLLVKAIYSLNPTARIIFVTQPERYDDNYGAANVCKLSYPPSDDSVRPYINAGGLTMGNIAGAIKECCSMMGISCIDLHSKLWTYQQCLHYLSNDGLHPNSELGWKIGELIGNYINKLIDINDLLV